MIRNLKTLGLAALAALALVAVMASAAQAAEGEITAEEYPSVLTGTQLAPTTSTIGAGVRIWTCVGANLDATVTAASTKVTVEPTFSNCTAAPGALPVTIVRNGCDYTLTATRPGTTGHGATTGTVSKTIDCPVGSAGIQIHIYENAAKHTAGTALCTYDIAAQGPIPIGVYHLEGAGATRSIKMTIEEKPVTKNTIGPKILCGGAANENVAATTKGEYKIEAFKDLGAPYTEGAQIGLFVS